METASIAAETPCQLVCSLTSAQVITSANALTKRGVKYAQRVEYVSLLGQSPLLRRLAPGRLRKCPRSLREEGENVPP